MNAEVLLEAAAEIERRADAASEPGRADWLRSIAAALRREAKGEK